MRAPATPDSTVLTSIPNFRIIRRRVARVPCALHHAAASIYVNDSGKRFAGSSLRPVCLLFAEAGRRGELMETNDRRLSQVSDFQLTVLTVVVVAVATCAVLLVSLFQ